MRIDIHHYHHIDGASEDVLKEIKRINLKLNNMATKAEFQQAIDQITGSLENIAADIIRLTERLENGGLSDTEETDIFNQLRSVADRAQQLADSTPETGEPTPPTEPTQPGEQA